MIWAGMVYLQDHTNMSEKEIRNLPYPKFQAMVEYHSDPEAFLKAGITKTDYDISVKEAQQQNMEMMRKALVKQKEREQNNGR
jgi:AMMECR1 domain-containing protein